VVSAQKIIQEKLDDINWDPKQNNTSINNSNSISKKKLEEDVVNLLGAGLLRKGGTY